MKEEVAKKMSNEKGNNIPKYKKIWFSISKFERYPEMASEGVGRAFGYLAFLIFIFSIIFALVLTCMLYVEMKEYVNYIDEEISVIEYKDGVLNIGLGTQGNYFTIGDVTVIIDTDEIDDDKVEEYKNIIGSDSFGAIWLKDRIIINYYGNEQKIYYQNIFSEIGFTEFNKTELIDYLNGVLQTPQIYLSYFVSAFAYSFALYFVSSLLNVLLLSVFGVLTGYITKLRMRYRAVFNMSVYAITLSIILQLIYYLVNLFTGFEIKYFDLMYNAIAYVCLAAAIFMIKSDVIRQNIEMIKIAKEKEKSEEEKQEEKEKSPEEDTRKSEEKESKENEENKDEGTVNDDKSAEENKKSKNNEDGENLEDGIEGQGSNA